MTDPERDGGLWRGIGFALLGMALLAVATGVVFVVMSYLIG